MSVYTPRNAATPRQQHLLEMLHELSGDRDPVKSIDRYVRGMRRTFGDQATVSVSLRGLPPGHYRVMRMLHQEGVAEPGLTDMLHAGEDAPVHRGGFLGALIDRNEIVVDFDFHLPADPVLGRQLAPYRSLVAFPVYDLGEASNWVCYLHTEAHAFSEEQVESRILQACLMGGVTSSKRRAHELEQANAWITRELDEIAGIQHGLLPPEMPSDSALDLATSYEVFDRAGGDYYDVFRFPGSDPTRRRYALFVADASGHGPSAAVVVAMVSALLQTYPRTPAGPAEVLDYLNQALLARPIRYSFVTAFFGIVDLQQRYLQYACAGHPMPMLRDTEGAVSSLRNLKGLPLGILPEATYDETAISVRPGQVLMVFTDGVSEAMAPDRELFGDVRLANALATAEGDAQAVVNNLHRALAAFRQGAPQTDDQTILVARFP